MATTTTLYNILESKLNRMGYNNVFDPKTNQIVSAGNERSIPYQLAKFTDEAYKAVNEEIFAGYILGSKEADRYFKNLFVGRNLLKEIKFQTLDMFRAKATSLLASNDQYISETYDLFDDLVKGTSTSKTTHEETTGKTHRNRNADSSLPQDNTELDLNNDIVNYADSTFYEKGSENGNANSEDNTISQTVDIDRLRKLKNIYNELLNEWEPKLFLQVYL